MTMILILALIALIALVAAWQAPALIARAAAFGLSRLTLASAGRNRAALIAAGQVARDPWARATRKERYLLAASFRNAMVRTQMRSLLPNAFA